ncbi:hypothetical protein L1987_04846 [Smallanthus sonchifolius]|uniref:Uncharacterized protein n=1 Tax=Smallanthus sonchifolius TaxID=185202 RepID=A0ACB9JTN8_9ASTR|nr:hypothetical protein L1987_04846 [Smallanthus sonchifolius]
MRVLEKVVTAGLLLLFLFITPSTVAIKSIKIRSDDRPIILFEKFGFTHTGNVSVSISNVSVSSTILQLYDPSVVGFFLLPDETLIQILLEVQQNPNFCVMDSKFVSLLFTLADISPSQSSFNKSFTVTNPNEYALFLANCNCQSPVTMDVRTELCNTVGNTKNYLSAGLTQLPGTSHGWNVLVYMFQFTNGVLSFTVIVLIGGGWLYLKPFLHAKEKMVLMIVISFQVPANVAFVVMGESGPFSKDWVAWNQVFIWANVMCRLAIIFPIVWSIRSLKEPSKTD